MAMSLISVNAWSLEEASVVGEMKNFLLKGPKCGVEGREREQMWNILTVDTKIHERKKGLVDYKVKGSKVGCGLGKYGSLVISPGRTESSMEYYETALDFIERGFSPIYIIDHVGQGFSKRLLKDPSKGHIHKFSDYVNGFESFVNHVQQDLKNVEGRKGEPLFFASNSMGTAIGLGYFQRSGKNNPFKAAALLGSMIRVNYLGFPGGLAPADEYPNGIECPSFIQSALGSERLVAVNAFIQQNFKHSYDEYATSNAREAAKKYGTAYVPGKRNFKKAFAHAPEQVLTHSRNRYDLKTFLWESAEMKTLLEEIGLSLPTISAPTLQWTKQTALFNKNMRSKRQVRKMSNMPIKIITGSRDVRAYKPKKDCSHDLSYHSEFCDKINKVKGSGTCSFTELNEAFHEIFKESDLYRNQGIELSIKHFIDSI
jgi:lysophospholipase